MDHVRWRAGFVPKSSVWRVSALSFGTAEQRSVWIARVRILAGARPRQGTLVTSPVLALSTILSRWQK